IVNNVRYVVDGGQPLYNIEPWDRGLADTLGATAQSDQRLHQLQQDIAARNPQSPYANNFDQLKADVNTSYEYFKGRVERNEIAVHDGPGRLDAFTEILNEVIIHDTQLTQKDANGNYVNDHVPDSPISLPFLWNVPDLECVQTNCVAQTPMERNL